MMNSISCSQTFALQLCILVLCLSHWPLASLHDSYRATGIEIFVISPNLQLPTFHAKPPRPLLSRLICFDHHRPALPLAALTLPGCGHWPPIHSGHTDHTGISGCRMWCDTEAWISIRLASIKAQIFCEWGWTFNAFRTEPEWRKVIFYLLSQVSLEAEEMQIFDVSKGNLFVSC